MRIIRLAIVSIALTAICGALTITTLNSAKANRALSVVQDPDPMKPLQHVVASKTAEFGTVDKDDADYRNALDAHELAGAIKLKGQEGSFKGTVSKFYEEPDGDLIVFQFDPNPRTALTALLRNANFPKFPDVKALAGKEIVVTGKFAGYHGKAQIELTDPAQIKLVK